MFNRLLRSTLIQGTLVGVVGAAVAGSARPTLAAPAGMAYHLTGKPQARVNGAWGALRMLQKLEAGDAVRCGAGDSAVIVIFKSGEQFKVGAGGTGTMQADKVAGAQSLGGLRGPSVRVARALTGARTGAVMARPGSAPSSLTPQAQGWILDNQRVIEWTPAQVSINPPITASSYSFVLFDRNSPIWSGHAQEAQVQLPQTLE